MKTGPGGSTHIIITYMSHAMCEGFSTDSPATILVQDSEGYPDHVLIVNSVHFIRHHVAELWKFNLSGPVSVVLKISSGIKVKKQVGQERIALSSFTW